MAFAGETIYNPVTTERITFVKTTEQTDGELLVFDCQVSPDAIPLRPHVHDKQEERFEVASGKLGVMLGGQKYILYPGDKAILPPRVRHQWWNAGDEDVRFRVEAEPALNLEATLEAIAGLADAGKLNKKAMPRNPFHLANIGRLSQTYLPGVPIWIQRVMLSVGSLTGRMFGIDPNFTAYRQRSTVAPLKEERAA